MEKKIRKTYITVIHKWLAKNTDFNAKEQLENKINFIHDTDKILETLNVKTPQDGLRKMFKLLSNYSI